MWRVLCVLLPLVQESTAIHLSSGNVLSGNAELTLQLADIFYAGQHGFERLEISTNMDEESDDEDSVLWRLLLNTLVGPGVWSICHHQPEQHGPLTPLLSAAERTSVCSPSLHPRIQSVLYQLSPYLPRQLLFTRTDKLMVCNVALVLCR